MRTAAALSRQPPGFAVFAPQHPPGGLIADDLFSAVIPGHLFAGPKGDISEQSGLRQPVGILDVARRRLARLDRIEKLSNMSGRVGDRLRRALKIGDPLASHVELVCLVVGYQRSFGTLEDAASRAISQVR